MAKINSLIDNTSEVIYPQTKAAAVIMEDSSTVENAINQRPKLVLSSQEPASTIDDNTLYGVYGDVGQITTQELSDSAVTTAKIASSAVTTVKIADGAITTAKINNGAVTGVANDATTIGTAKLALNTVGTPNLRNTSVTSSKIDWATIRIVLFEDASGVNDNVTLSSPASNFDGLLIIFRNNDNHYGSQYIEPAVQRFTLCLPMPTTSTLYIKTTAYSISGANIYRDAYGEWANNNRTDSANIFITKVIGIKY